MLEHYPFLVKICHLVQEGHFQRSLALIAGLSGLLSGLEVLMEHYRGSYGQKIMYTPVLCAALLGSVGITGAFSSYVALNLLPWAGGLLIMDGLVGFGFHIRGIARKPGGWRRNLTNNIIMGPPLFAPLLLGIGGWLAIIAAFLVPENAASSVTPERLELIRKCFAAAAAGSAVLNGFEVLYSHYKSRFSHITQWIPIILTPPLILFAAGAIIAPVMFKIPLAAISLLALAAGGLGTIMHLRGIVRRPGGMRSFGYNLLYGPPAFAPLLFAASGLFGLIAVMMEKSL